MSEARRSVPRMLNRSKIRDHRGHHPWRTIGMFPDWRVEFTHDLPPTQLGETIHREKRVLIHADLGQAERRDAICHEMGHVLRGPRPTAHRLAEEALVDRQAGRLLMPSVRRIGHALAWSRGAYEAAADDLWVSERLLNVRLSTLAPADRIWLDDQLDHIFVNA